MQTLSSLITDSSWKEILKPELSSQNFAHIERALDEISKTSEIYPPRNLIFNALNLTPFNNVKAVILGQDPYHGTNQAMGLSFSVPAQTKIPPSLKNIIKEICADIGSCSLVNGDLSAWARQGVLLLNATLSVSAGTPNSHSRLGWENFTDAIIRALSEKRENIVFMLWGNFAIKKSALIDTRKHLILTAAHPSPLARGAFFGCAHFSKCNNYLKFHKKNEILW